MSLARHTIYNLVGTIIPLALALVTIPIYIKLIGPERYGVLAIAWLILGYFGLFDLGLGRATSQRIAALRDNLPEERAAAFGTALIANFGIGVLGALIMAPIGWLLLGRQMATAPELRMEAVAAVPLLAIAVPIATTIGVLSGALIGRERFLTSNRIGVLSTSLFQIIPLGIAWLFGPNLTGLLAASLAARLIGLLMLWRACASEFGRAAFRCFDQSQLRALLAFGGWVTLTSVFGPLLVVLDRFVIGALMSAIAVTIYTVPMQLTTRLTSLTAALANAMFPRLAVASKNEALGLGRISVATLLACTTPGVIAAFIVMRPALVLWLGENIGGQAAPIGRVVLVAAWLNTFAQIPYSRLQAAGRPDLVTKVLLAELPIYIPGLFWALPAFGLMGAAVVYTVRAMVDLIALTFLAFRQLPHFGSIVAYCLIFAGFEAFIRIFQPSVLLSFALAALAFVSSAIPSWRMLPDEARAVIAPRSWRGLLLHLGAGSEL